MMDEHFASAKWFKYGQDTLLAKTQEHGGTIQRLGEKSRKTPFWERRKRGWERKLIFIKYFLSQALF